MNLVFKLACGALMASTISCATVVPDAQTPKAQTRAQELARQHVIVDTHIDTPYRIHGGWVDVTQATEGGQFDYPRAAKGGLNIPFMSIYTPAGSAGSHENYQLAHELIDGVEAMAARAPSRFMVVRSVDDVDTAMKEGKVGLALGMENGTALDGKLENIGLFARRGIRYITLTHSLSNEIADSSFDPERQWNGLSDFGREVVAEMNRKGVMVDISHVSDETFWQVLELSKVPVIASHSSARHFVPGFERNMSDEMITALGKNGGVIQINLGSSFLTADANKYLLKIRAERKVFLEENDFEAGGAEEKEFIQTFVKENSIPYATLEQVVDHFDHVIGLVGAEHVGIGSDYDGVGDSLPVGLKDVSSYPNLVAEFMRRGYSEEDIVNIIGGNLLRVWRQVEDYARAH